MPWALRQAQECLTYGLRPTGARSTPTAVQPKCELTGAPGSRAA